MAFAQTSNAHLRLPSLLRPESKESDETSFALENFTGEWYIQRTSNAFFSGKYAVRTFCSPTGEDKFLYQNSPASATKCMQWNTSRVPDSVCTYVSQGTGLMRLFSATWEVLALGEGWMVTFQRKTMVTAAAINILSREKTGLGESSMQMIMGWLREVKSSEFQKALERLFVVPHD